MKIVKVGQMITFAEGEYSDYCVEALVRVTKEFDLELMKNKWIDECCYQAVKNSYWHRMQHKTKDGEPDFLPWLVSHGLVEDVDYIEVHTGSYWESNITWND